MKPLSLIRPKTFSELIGQERLIKSIRGRVKERRLPKAWLFMGDSGLGKTTLARIIAVSLQCTHQKEFGEPCKACRIAYKKKKFPIFEENVADKTGVEELRKFVRDSEFHFLGQGKRRVYILDEAHRITRQGQDLLLKYLEDEDNPTVWMLCSTEPSEIRKTLRRRCAKLTLKPLDSDELAACVKHYLKIAKSDRNSEELVDELITHGVDSPGFVAQAVDAYASGEPANKAAAVEAPTEIDTKPLCIAVTAGSWEEVVQFLQAAPSADARGIRVSVAGWLKTMLCETPEINSRNKTIADCIAQLSYMPYTDNYLIMTALTAELYKLCALFSKYSRKS